MKYTWIAGNGESLVFDENNIYLQSIEGVGGAPSTIQTQKAPYQDGSTLIDQVLEERDIPILLGIRGLNREELFSKRRILIRLFNPKLGVGTLRLEIGTNSYEIKGTPDGGPEFPYSKSRTNQPALINIRAPDPNWYNPKTEKRTLASFVGGFSFPFSFPLSFGEVGDFLEVENKGDVDTPVFVVFKGPLKNPVLENKTTGQKITVTQEIPAGESLEINTAFGKKSVFRVLADGSRVSAFNWVDPKSKLWQLIPGVNEISYSATDEAGNAAASISFNHRYVGV